MHIWSCSVQIVSVIVYMEDGNHGIRNYNLLWTNYINFNTALSKLLPSLLKILL